MVEGLRFDEAGSVASFFLRILTIFVDYLINLWLKRPQVEL